MHAQPQPDSLPTPPMPTPLLLWDVFCQVVDNLGDIGVCWRLAADLAARGHQVRLWVDDPTALHWMAPGALAGLCTGIEVFSWQQSTRAHVLQALPLADVWVETFGCEIAAEFIAFHAHAMTAKGLAKSLAKDLKGTQSVVWINLEHLTAEGFAQRNHTLPSPVMRGPAAGWTKYFFYPGFTQGTGGLLREANMAARQAKFDRAQWLATHGIGWQGERLVSLFCYEPAALADFLQQLRTHPTPTLLLVTPGRAANAVQATQQIDQACASPQANALSALSIVYLPPLTQLEYDELLWACDFNCVRGEDSWVRALWANKPFVWHIYPQDDGAHHAKLDAFLDLIQAHAGLRQFHWAWNAAPNDMPKAPPNHYLPPLDLTAWQASLGAAQQRLLHSADLCSQLIRFVQKTR